MIASILVLAALATGAAAETFSGVATFNPPWSGVACGGDYDTSKFLVAMGLAKFGSMVNGNTSPVCGHTITVNYQGKSLVATVVDKMMEPRVNGIDLSPSAFTELAGDLTAGRLDVTWSWNDGFDPATGPQDKAGLAAVSLGGSAPTATSSVSAVASSATTSDPAGASVVASDTALAAGADAVATSSTTAAVASVGTSASSAASVASGDTAANDVVSAASSSTTSTSTTEPAPAGDTGRPTGYGGHRADRQRRCAAQL